ncbi:MAG TPA: ribonuclease R [Tepidisphaeraceae bacterium]|nr:ribonuclease R [Tepidisphaeraceae bacterium]
MSEELQEKIVKLVNGERYRPMKPRSVARELGVHDEKNYPRFKKALGSVIEAGRVGFGKNGNVTANAKAAPTPAAKGPIGVGVGVVAAGKKRQVGQRGDVVVGSYKQNKRGFGFVIPTEPKGHEDLFIPPGKEGGAITGDTVKATITGAELRDGKMKYDGRVTSIVQRTDAKFVGTLTKRDNKWVVLPDGNDFIEAIEVPDAGSRHVKPGTKVAVELTRFPEDGVRAAGVITDVIGVAGEKDVDLRAVMIQHDLPGDFPEECKVQARQALDRFNRTLEQERAKRLDLTDQLICTIDPDDAKDYDDAISLRRLDNGNWQLGVHIADVAFFVEPGSPLDEEAAKRGNSIYFPGFVIPMLPEVLSNGVCSLQEGVPRLCKSAFIELDEDGRPVGTKFANTIIKSAKRLRYVEAQAILDRKEEVPHPDGTRTVAHYEPEVVALLDDMDQLAKLIQKRRHAAGQLVLGLPDVDLVLDEEGKVMGAVPEDESYTHTLIEMFMVEANEAVARLLNSLEVPFLRRGHAEPATESTERLRQFVQMSGYKLGKEIDRKALQALLEDVKGKPDAFAVNLAVLKSLARAEYTPDVVGHYALASEHYGHFTSPIRRYADLTVHRLLDEYFVARERAGREDRSEKGKRRKLTLENVVPFEDLAELGKHLAFTERRADDAEKELRQVKLLELLAGRIGEEFQGVITSVTKFGIFIQLQEYLIDGLIRYEDLMDDYWDVDERGGVVRGKRTGKRIAVGDLARVAVVKVDVPRRELSLAIKQLLGHPGGRVSPPEERHSSNRQKPQKGQSKGRAHRNKPPAKGNRRGRKH